jgi:DNA-binding transcriptional MerR regulator/methylmalonyl-CoA mutase cobalamin-binding subunit
MSKPVERRAQPLYKIGAVAQETGIATETLRVWERRYRVVVPGRTPRGGRLYSDDDLARLRLIKDLIDRGHAIGQVARLDDGQLRVIRERLDQPGPALGLDELRVRFLDAAARLDAHGAHQILARAALLLGPRALAIDLLAPLLQELGDRWAVGSARVCHEHMASAIVRTVLGGLVLTQSGAGGGRRLVVATPRAELHELGALLCALLAGAAGWDVLYLGPSLPAAEIVEAAARGRATAVAISLTSAARRETEVDLRHLVRELPATLPLLAGGAGAASSAALARRAVVFGDLAALDDWLRREDERA